MIDEVQSLLDQYWDWLKDRTSIRHVNDWIEVTIQGYFTNAFDRTNS